MNQYIKIYYKFNSIYDWIFVFWLNDKEHREKAPSDARSSGYWDWYYKGQFQEEGSKS